MRRRHISFRPGRARARRARWDGVAGFAGLCLIALAFLSTDGFRRWPPATETSDAASERPAPRGVIAGRARIVDGDTLDINGQRVRLWGVDAPERGQSCDRAGAPGRSATSALSRTIAGRDVSCHARDRDDYGRVVAACSVGGVDLGQRLVSEGWAWDYRQYSRGRYARAEADARDAERGVWALGCDPAWEWRRQGG